MPDLLTPVSLRMTPDEYVEWEETQEDKHDYIYGEVFLMSGSTRTHNTVATNFLVALHRAFAGTDCEVFNEGMRVQVEPGGRYTYPDVSAVCGEAEFTTLKQTTRVNPCLIVEVLSERRMAYDRGEKLDATRGLASIREIVILWQDRRAAAVYRREATGRWSIKDVGADGTLALGSVNADVAMADLYAGTEVAP